MDTFSKCILVSIFVGLVVLLTFTAGCNPYDVVSEVPAVPTSFWSP